MESIKEVDPKALRARGITAIITDLDNTLVPWRKYDIAPSVVEWLAKLEVEGIKICIASNTLHMSRLQQLAETMGIPFVDRVRKPAVGGFVRSMELMASDPGSTAVFGDQIFTDVWAGNRLGLKTILLRPPLSKEEFISTQLVRSVENVMIRQLRKIGLWPEQRRLEDIHDPIPDPLPPSGFFAKSGIALPLVLVGIFAAVVIFFVRRRKGK